MDAEDQLRELIRESIIEEGIMDWLFSRWRKGGRFLGTSGQGAGYIEDAQNQLKNIYAAMGKLHKGYPRATKRVRDNVKRVILDLEHINTLIGKGVDEKTFLKSDLD